MSIENATPRPWEVKRWQHGVNRQRTVVVIESVLSGQPVAKLYVGQPNANAELIVTAVNQHEALLDALRAIRDLCDTRSLGETLGNSIAIRSVAEQAIRAAEGIETNVAKPWEAGE